MMLLCDIPDKLAVTAFVYQMYNYFTKSVPSAVTKYKATSAKEAVSPSAVAPFDLTQFDQFTLPALSPDEKPSKSMANNPYVRNNISEDETPTVAPVLSSALPDDQVSSHKTDEYDKTASVEGETLHAEIDLSTKPTKQELREEATKLSTAASPVCDSSTSPNTLSSSDIVPTSSTSPSANACQQSQQDTVDIQDKTNDQLRNGSISLEHATPVETELMSNGDRPNDSSTPKKDDDKLKVRSHGDISSGL